MPASSSGSPGQFPRFSRGRAWALAACLAALIIGCRWAIIGRYGTDLPEWDQWDAEGAGLLSHWGGGGLRLGHVLAAHNEHRVALTRLVTLALAKLDGQWDQRLEAVCNAFLPAMTAAALFLMTAWRTSRGRAALFGGLLALFYATPVAWENITHGFHSQQHFLVGLALGTLALLPFAEAYSAAWWAGAACAFLSLGSMATGFFAPLISGGVLIVLVVRRNRTLRAAAPALAICGVAVAIGVVTRATIAANDSIQAHSFHDFFMTVVRAIGWPDFDLNWGYASLLLYAPWAWMMIRLARARDREPEPWPVLLGALGLWTLAQCVAAGYARGDGGVGPPSRYLDTLIVGLMANALCLEVLTRQTGENPRDRDLARILLWSWAGLFAIGIVGHEIGTFQGEMAAAPDYHKYGEANVRHYVATGDPAYLAHDEIPYPSAAVLAMRLDDPNLRRLLPASVAPPLPLDAAGNSFGFSVSDTRVPEARNQKPRAAPGISPRTPPLSDQVTWGSFGASGAPARGTWRSRPLVSPVGGWLRFEIAGNPGTPGVELELHDAASGRLLSSVRPDKPPGDSWRTAWVRAPRGRFVIVARDESARGWLAFSEPVEMGRASRWALGATRWGGLLGALGLATGLVIVLWPPRRT